MEKTLTFAIGFLPFLIPSMNPDPQSFWSEICATIILGLLLLCGIDRVDINTKRTLP